MASELNTEKNPIRWEALKTVASSSKIRFWSADPPLTLKPLLPSPAGLIPGNSWMVFKTSFSPNNTGMLLISLVFSFCIPIVVRDMFSSRR